MVHTIHELLPFDGQKLIIQAPAESIDRDRYFEQILELFPEAYLEMDKDGNIVMTPGNCEDSGFRSGQAYLQLALWAKQDGQGRAFDASTIFNLPDGSKRSPDASWVSKEVLRREGSAVRHATQTRHVPHYLIEVLSPSNRLTEAQDKCRSWIRNGVAEVALLAPDTQTAYVFRAGDEMTTIVNAQTVSSLALPGFTIDCAPIWEALVD